MEQRKRFQIAMALYAVLALMAWFLMSSERVPIGSGGVSLRGVTLVILAFFAMKTMLQRRAEIREAQREEGH